MSNGPRKLILAACLVGTGLLTRYVVAEVWEESTGEAPPKNPAADGVDWSQALIWTTTASLAVGIGRTVVRHMLADSNDREPVT